MTDFTKEELENILVCINGGSRHNLNAYELAEKVQSMIDSYCEYDINQCPNCGKVIK